MNAHVTSVSKSTCTGTAIGGGFRCDSTAQLPELATDCRSNRWAVVPRTTTLSLLISDLPAVARVDHRLHASADASARAMSSALTTSTDGSRLESSASSAGATVCSRRARSRLQAMTTLRA